MHLIIKVGLTMTEYDPKDDFSFEEQPQEQSQEQPADEGNMPQEWLLNENYADGAAVAEDRFDLKREVVEWMEAIVYALVAVVLVFTFLFRIVGVDGESMTPTLQDEDRLIVTHLFYDPQPGDIIVTTQPSAVNRPLIKRIIAVEGQTVDINFDTGEVTVDGVTQIEPYIKEPTYNKGDIDFPITVEKGKVFVMGDNRNDSLDSRFSQVGQIDERYILGKAVFRIFPFTSIGGLY